MKTLTKIALIIAGGAGAAYAGSKVLCRKADTIESEETAPNPEDIEWANHINDSSDETVEE